MESDPYFTTGTRKYIIADAPGHEQYTRNMVTAASLLGVERGALVEQPVSLEGLYTHGMTAGPHGAAAHPLKREQVFSKPLS
ncbi:hypothetical protein [Propionivibrio sp.]|uniref:hypothetical protein n=1 Tax=Propionivibrio sp. TaxID=2212460 RepID=UPI003BF03EE8